MQADTADNRYTQDSTYTAGNTAVAGASAVPGPAVNAAVIGTPAALGPAGTAAAYPQQPVYGGTPAEAYRQPVYAGQAQAAPQGYAADMPYMSTDEFNRLLSVFAGFFRAAVPFGDRQTYDEWYRRLCGYSPALLEKAVGAYAAQRGAVFGIDEICRAADAYSAKRTRFEAILKGIETSFPGTFRGAENLEMWFRCLGDIEINCLEKAVMNHIMTSKFPPKIAEIREIAVRMQAGPEPVPSVEWQKLVSALPDAYSETRARDAYESLHGITKLCVGGFKGFRALSMTDTETREKVTKPMFLKEFKLRYEGQIKRMAASSYGTPAPQMEEYIAITDKAVADSGKKPDTGGKIPMPKHLKEQLYARLGVQMRENPLLAFLAPDDGGIRQKGGYGK